MLGLKLIVLITDVFCIGPKGLSLEVILLWVCRNVALVQLLKTPKKPIRLDQQVEIFSF